MTTLGAMIVKVRRVLADPGGDSPLYSTDLLTDGVLESLIAILPWVSKESTLTLTGDGTTYEFSLPSNCAEVQALWSESAQSFLPMAGLFPGTPWAHGEGSAIEPNSWVEYPHGQLSLAAPPFAGEKLIVFYTAYWPEPANTTDTLAVPAYALPGITYYTAAYALNPKATSAANIRQFNTKIDSGTPIQNAMVEMGKYFMARFVESMNSCPSRQRGQKSR